MCTWRWDRHLQFCASVDSEEVKNSPSPCHSQDRSRTLGHWIYNPARQSACLEMTTFRFLTLFSLSLCSIMLDLLFVSVCGIYFMGGGGGIFPFAIYSKIMMKNEIFFSTIWYMCHVTHSHKTSANSFWGILRYIYSFENCRFCWLFWCLNEDWQPKSVESCGHLKLLSVMAAILRKRLWKILCLFAYFP